MGVQKIQKEIVVEEQKKLKKIAAQKAHMAEVFKENTENRERAQKDAAAQVAADIKTMKQQNKLMEEQDKAKAAEKEARMARQKALMERMKKTVMAQAQAKGQEDEIRAAKQKEEADLRAMENALIKQTKLKELRCDIRDYQLTQIAIKSENKQSALELKKLQANVLKNDSAQYTATEAKKVLTKKLRNYEHQKELQKQILAKEQRVKNVEMSAAEESINRSLLDHVSRALEEKRREAAP